MQQGFAVLHDGAQAVVFAQQGVHVSFYRAGSGAAHGGGLVGERAQIVVDDHLAAQIDDEALGGCSHAGFFAVGDGHGFVFAQLIFGLQVAQAADAEAVVGAEVRHLPALAKALPGQGLGGVAGQ